MAASAFRSTYAFLGTEARPPDAPVLPEAVGVTEKAAAGTRRPEPVSQPAPAGELERRALDGDAAAWSALVAQHNRKVVVALLARGAPIEQAKDLAQETWLRLIESQRAGRLASISLPGLAIVQAGYLLHNAQREGRHVANAAEPRDPGGDSDGWSGPASTDPAPLPEELVLHRDRVERVASALSTCPPSARRVFEFVYDHPELPYTDVAARFGLSTQRIKQTVCEVRKRLRAALLDEEA